MMHLPRVISILLIGLSAVFGRAVETDAADPTSRPKRVLLLGQKPDGHPAKSHEYMAGVRLLAKLLQNRGGVQTVVVQADNPWADGPELLDGADGAVLFLAEGARWVSADPERLSAFQRLAKRGGGLAVLHWGMGTREAAPVENFVSLFGHCHGGPDRKYKVLTATINPSSEPHPILNGIAPVEVHDEFYYALKQPPQVERLVPLIRVSLEDSDQTVAWAWERPDHGRSFGFSGLHYHDNWKRVEYRRLVLQGVLWSVSQTIPADGLNVDVTEADLVLEPRPATP